MKKYVGMFVLLAFFAGSIGVRAETNDVRVPPTGTGKINDVRKEIENVRAKADALREEARAARGDINVLREKVSAMGTALFRDAAIKRAAFGFAQMQNIEKRMESYIAKLKADGVDTSSSDAKVQAVKDAMTAATAKLETLKQTVATATGSTATGTDRSALNATIKTAKQDAETAVKAVRTAIDDLMKLLKTYKVPKPVEKTESTN